jgi:hypothetical protein
MLYFELIKIRIIFADFQAHFKVKFEIKFINGRNKIFSKYNY